MPIEWKFSGKQDVYLEIAKYYEKHILLGVLREGDKLPSVRVAAGELGVNPNTVARAYARLEEMGYVRALPKKGAFVTYAPDAKTDAKEEKKAEPTDAASLICRNTVIALKDSGITRATLLALIEEVYGND